MSLDEIMSIEKNSFWPNHPPRIFWFKGIPSWLTAHMGIIGDPNLISKFSAQKLESLRTAIHDGRPWHVCGDVLTGYKIDWNNETIIKEDIGNYGEFDKVSKKLSETFTNKRTNLQIKSRHVFRHAGYDVSVLICPAEPPSGEYKELEKAIIYRMRVPRQPYRVFTHTYRIKYAEDCARELGAQLKFSYCEKEKLIAFESDKELKGIISTLGTNPEWILKTMKKFR